MSAAEAIPAITPELLDEIERRARAAKGRRLVPDHCPVSLSPDDVLALVAAYRRVEQECDALAAEKARLEEELRNAGGRVLQAVRERFRTCNHQTTAGLIESVGAATPKEVNNVLSYLTRKGQIDTGYGKYRSLGETSR